jgi:hypothetical protein
MNPGTYNAVTIDGGAVWESEGGAVMVDIPMDIDLGGGATERDVAAVCIVLKDGSPSERGIQTLKTCFGWDGLDIGTLEACLPGKQVEVVCDNETFTGKDGKDRTKCRIRWVNPPGGSLPVRQKADMRSLASRLNSKLRAISGGAPVKPAAKTPPAPVKKSPPPPKPKAAEPTSTMEDCWNLLQETMAGKTDEEISAKWLEVTNNTDPADITPEQWGKIRLKCTDDLPY